MVDMYLFCIGVGKWPLLLNLTPSPFNHFMSLISSTSTLRTSDSLKDMLT